MPVTIRIPTPFRKFTGGTESAQISADNLAELIENLEQKFPGLKQAICAADGTPHRFVNIYVNDEDIRYLQKEATTLKDGDNISIVPSIAGGTA